MDITPVDSETIIKEGKPLVPEPRTKLEIGFEGSQKPPTLSEVSARLVTLFDLKPTEEYVSTNIDAEKPLTPEELLALTRFQKCEVIILSKTNPNGSEDTRLISGYANSCDIQELLPVKQVLPPLGEYDKPPILLRHIYGHMEVAADGSETITPWNMEIHTHIGNDPYPSNRDLEGVSQRSKVCLIDSRSGVTIYGQPPEKPQNVPEKLKETFGDRKTSELMFDGSVIIKIKQYAEKSMPVGIANNPRAKEAEFKRIACEIFDIPIKIIPWTDVDDIRNLLQEIFEKKCDPNKYFVKK